MVLTILLIGKTGAGKSTLGNTILGLPHNNKNGQGFDTSSGTSSETASMAMRNAFYFGDANSGLPIRVIDTPGWADSKGRDVSFKDQLEKTMQTVENVHVLLWCRNGQDVRIDSNEQEAIKSLAELFGIHLFNNAIMNLNMWSHSLSAEKTRKKTGRNIEVFKHDLWREFTKGIIDESPMPIFTLDALYDEEDDEQKKAFESNKDELEQAIREFSSKPVYSKAVLKEQLDQLHEKEKREKLTGEDKYKLNELGKAKERAKAGGPFWAKVLLFLLTMKDGVFKLTSQTFALMKSMGIDYTIFKIVAEKLGWSEHGITKRKWNQFMGNFSTPTSTPQEDENHCSSVEQ